MLRGRSAECGRLEQLLYEVRAGQSGALVVRGEAGMGKSVLLDHLADRASGCRVDRTCGIESEMELPFAGLHLLCSPMLEHVERLPGPQRDALSVAFGLRDGEVPDLFLIGLAVLGLLSEIADEEPLVCIVDDAHWLDRSSLRVLAFVARRLSRESVAMVMAVRSLADGGLLAGLEVLEVEGLHRDEARALLEAAAPGVIDGQVLDRIVMETRGNPLALTELQEGLTPAELAGGYAVPAPRSTEDSIELGFRRRLEALPDGSRRLLLLAAAEPVGDVPLLWRAAERLGIDAEAAAPAAGAGLLEVGVRVRFRHPLVRSAVYRSATLAERQSVHRALAESTDPRLDPDRRAWHHACAASEPDEAVADELQRSAERARSRGGVAAAAAFLERATRLTPDPARRGERTLSAARAKLEAAAPDDAWALLADAEACPLDDLQHAQLARLRAEIAFDRSRGRDAPPLLLEAARRLAPLDAALAREVYLEALGSLVFSGRLGSVSAGSDVTDAARRAPPAPVPGATDLLLDGLVVRFTEGQAAAVAPLQRALRAFVAEAGDPGVIPSFWLACRVAPELWDDETWNQLTARHLDHTRNAGLLSRLPIALTYRAGVEVHAGQLDVAAALIDEASAITHATGGTPLVYSAFVLAAWTGQETEALRMIATGAQSARVRGEGRAITMAEYSTAVLYNGLGRYPEARAAAERACEADDLGLLGWALVELVEAAVRSDRADVARDAVERLGTQTQAAGTDWALGTEARSRALLSRGAAADALYREAVDRLGRTRIAVHLARTHLVYGEWLGGEGRRDDAREQLHRAHAMLSSMGALGFAGRARVALAAGGDTVRDPEAATVDDLTAQELQIAQLARDGQTNPEIGAQLFLSPRTVEWHLHKVFSKLDITSRRDLGRALPDRSRPTLRA